MQIKAVERPAPRVGFPLCPVRRPRRSSPGRQSRCNDERGPFDVAELHPVTGEDPATLRRLAEQCRRLARGASTATVATSLEEIAGNYETLAARAEASQPPPPPAPVP